MNYINRFQLIREMVQKKPLDSKQLLSDVDIRKVTQALQKSKDGVPRPFRYTGEPMEEQNLAKMPQHDKEQLWALYGEIRESTEAVLPKLIALKNRYPQVPCIYNYVAYAYALLQQEQQNFNILCETTRLFPEYFFGKISLAEYYINHNDHRKIPGIFNNKFEIYEHYPESVEVFHISEVRSFYIVIGRYFVRTNNLTRALYCYFTVEEVDPEHLALRQLGDEIVGKELKKLSQDFSKNAPKRRKRRS